MTYCIDIIETLR